MRQGFRLVTALKWAAVAAGALCALSLSAALGQGLAPLSRVPVLLSAGEGPDHSPLLLPHLNDSCMLRSACELCMGALQTFLQLGVKS
jgi:hypothetical protein